MEGLSTILSTVVPSTTTFMAIPAMEGMAQYQSTYLWALVSGFGLAFALGFGMGANDVANAFGTSVGSKVLSLKMAYILATIFETLGAVFVGYGVADTMRKQVIDTDIYKDSPAELLLGQVAILGGGSAWLFLATILKAPVSTTHSIVGATLGFSFMMKGFKGIQWGKVVEIACSWVLSPLMSGMISTTLYMIVDFVVLRRRNPVKCGLNALPVFYFFCIAFNVFAVSCKGAKLIGLENIPPWLAAVFSLGLGFCASLLVQFVVRPRLVAWIDEGDDINGVKLSSIATKGVTDGTPKISAISSPANGLNALTLTTSNNCPGAEVRQDRTQKFHPSPKGLIKWFFPKKNRQEDAKTLKLFSSIQVFTACFAGFAHGSNDVSNAIAPLAALLSVYNAMSVEQKEQTPIYVLLYGVLAICTGLWILGHRVMKTVGQRMSEINPASGFTIEFGAAVTALVASKIGLPISTTHCLVGSVVAVGSVKSGQGVDWKIFGGIALSWVVTLPVSAILSATIMLVLKNFFL